MMSKLSNYFKVTHKSRKRIINSESDSESEGIQLDGPDARGTQLAESSQSNVPSSSKSIPVLSISDLADEKNERKR